jgi:uncharacterized membrane protein
MCQVGLAVDQNVSRLRLTAADRTGPLKSFVPLMQLKQNFTFKVEDEREAGVGTLGSCRTVQVLALTQCFDRLSIVLAQPTEKAVV